MRERAHFIDILLTLVSWSSATSLIKSHSNNHFQFVCQLEASSEKQMRDLNQTFTVCARDTRLCALSTHHHFSLSLSLFIWKNICVWVSVLAFFCTNPTLFFCCSRWISMLVIYKYFLSVVLFIASESYAEWI